MSATISWYQQAKWLDAIAADIKYVMAFSSPGAWTGWYALCQVERKGLTLVNKDLVQAPTGIYMVKFSAAQVPEDLGWIYDIYRIHWSGGTALPGQLAMKLNSKGHIRFPGLED